MLIAVPMKAFVCITLVLVCCGAVAHAQGTIWNNDTTLVPRTKLERLGIVTGCSLAFSLYDYLGYNLVRKHSAATAVYRITQGTLQLAISYFLYKELGLSSAISFNLLWWTWCDDLAFYGYSELFNPQGPVWENRTDSGLLDPQIYWAWWTPVGLTRPKSALIARDVLLTQAAIGLALSIAID